MAEALGDLAAFVAVARASGFREAARICGVTASSLSEVLRRLEAQLNVRLLNRSAMAGRMSGLSGAIADLTKG